MPDGSLTQFNPASAASEEYQRAPVHRRGELPASLLCDLEKRCRTGTLEALATVGRGRRDTPQIKS
jgi:hypothetical protein